MTRRRRIVAVVALVFALLGIAAGVSCLLLDRGGRAAAETPEEYRYKPLGIVSAHIALLEKPEILVTKKGKKGNLREVDLRPMIFSARAEGPELKMNIAQGSEANLKPELFLEALYAADAGGTLRNLKTAVVRTELYDAEGKALESYGSRIEN